MKAVPKTPFIGSRGFKTGVYVVPKHIPSGSRQRRMQLLPDDLPRTYFETIDRCRFFMPQPFDQKIGVICRTRSVSSISSTAS